jgi:transcriptional regulator with XRE-family HTH domain
MDYIELLKNTRLEKGESRESVAFKIGCTERCLQYWENKEREPSYSNFIRWANVLGFRLEVINV